MTDEYIGEPGLREKIIAIICEEWPPPDNELYAADILERLQSEGVEASEQAVLDVLLELVDHGHMFLGEGPTGAGPTILEVNQELCE